jgi:DNA polymerase-1
VDDDLDCGAGERVTGPLHLDPKQVPDETVRHPGVGALYYTGRDAFDAVAAMPAGLDVAIDIETPSVTDSFTIKCVTAAWESGGETHCVLLDPLRRDADAHAVRRIVASARWLILHGSPFDIPGLVAAKLMELRDIAKVMDTLLLARAAWPDTYETKSLEALAPKVLGLRSLSGALAAAIKASGLASKERWFRDGDIDMPTYRRGAMSDTVVTLRLAWTLFEEAVSRQLNHPFATYGHTSRDTATEEILKLLRVNRVFLRRAARGYHVDLDYLDGYVDKVTADRTRAEKFLVEAGCRPGVGLDVVTKIDEAGQLPRDWKRTPTGRLKADKKAMELLPDNPLANAHRQVAHIDKVLGYMEKTVARSAVTGLLHPQFHVLGASATGRMSASEPEVQQFPEDARPIILADPGRSLTSVDWTSIEPALLGWMARDWGFIDPFEAGADIYEPVQTAAGIARKQAKVLVLAVLYGQGKASTAAALGCTTMRADEIKRGMLRAMPECDKHMRIIKRIGSQYGLVLTVTGRVLTLPQFNGVYSDHKAVNYTCQGSCADLLYHSVDLADQAGLADYIDLPLHDELVVDTEVAPEIQRIMSTPPEMLIARAGGRVPVIRTDSHELGAQWLAC